MSPGAARNDEAFDLLFGESGLLNVAENDHADAAVDDAGKVGLGVYVRPQSLMTAQLVKDLLDDGLQGRPSHCLAPLVSGNMPIIYAANCQLQNLLFA